MRRHGRRGHHGWLQNLGSLLFWHIGYCQLQVPGCPVKLKKSYAAANLMICIFSLIPFPRNMLFEVNLLDTKGAFSQRTREDNKNCFSLEDPGVCVCVEQKHLPFRIEMEKSPTRKQSLSH